MTPKVFVDSDIILDLLWERPPHYEAAARVFILFETGKAKGFVSPLIFSNLFYLLRKQHDADKALQVLKKLKSFVHVLPMDDQIVERALRSGFRDFEDALQYHAALKGGMECILTRNQADYRKADIPAYSAGEFLAARKGD